MDGLLASITPSSFNLVSYDTKVQLLVTLILALHHLDTFKLHLIPRLDSLADLVRQKSELLIELKRANSEKNTFIKTVFQPLVKSLQA